MAPYYIHNMNVYHDITSDTLLMYMQIIIKEQIKQVTVMNYM